MKKRSQKQIYSSQSLSLLIVLLMLLAYTCHPSPCEYGLTGNSGHIMGDALLNRLSYHFLHANVIHLFINSWSLLGICFYSSPKLRHILLAFIVASLYPHYQCHAPIVGMSGTIYALMGIMFFLRHDKLFILGVFFVYSLIGFYAGNVAVGLHLFCFILGMFIGILDTDLFK